LLEIYITRIKCFCKELFLYNFTFKV